MTWTVTAGYKCTFLWEGGTEAAAEESVVWTAAYGYVAIRHNCLGYYASGREHDVEYSDEHWGTCSRYSFITDCKGSVVAILSPPGRSVVVPGFHDAAYAYVEGFVTPLRSFCSIGKWATSITYGSDRVWDKRKGLPGLRHTCTGEKTGVWRVYETTASNYGI